jgi:N-acetylglucosamine kinase-like BadF-type ATPase
MAADRKLVIGVDGGGTKTEAILAELDPEGQAIILGSGESGPSNMRLAGRRQALDSLDEAISSAVGGFPSRAGKADVAVLALAGSNFADIQQEIRQWADRRGICKRLEIISDAAPVLAAGTPEGWGVALVVGTGSIAIGVDRSGRWITKGGWGHWYGDKGSGYDLGRRALAAISEAEDGMGPETVLSEKMLEYFGLENPRLIIQALYTRGNVRSQVAAAAPVVLDAAESGDIVAVRVVEAGVGELVRLVTSATCDLELTDPYPLALAGGVICRHPSYQKKLETGLNAINPPPGQVSRVPQPVTGCIRIGQLCLENRLSPGVWPLHQ